MVETKEYYPAKNIDATAVASTHIKTVEYAPGSLSDAGAAVIERHAVAPKPNFGYAQRMERLRKLADEVVESIPQELMQNLHGGIAISDRAKLHPDSDPRKPLYILGEYCNSNSTGRHIMLYGGSIQRAYGNLSDTELRSELDRIIRHELTHHWESLSGTRDLEIYDANRISRYKHDLDKFTKTE